MASVTSVGNTFNTTTGTHTLAGTPALNDLIIIVAADTTFTGVTTPTDNNVDGLGAYTLITSALKATSADNLRIYVRNSLIGSATSTTFSQAAASSTGGGLQVYRISGAVGAGLAAIRQSAAQANQAAASTPAPAFTRPAVTNNPIITAVFNATSPATMTPRSSPAYTEDADVGYSTPTTGLETAHINSGETASTITYGGTSASAFSSVAVEINAVTIPSNAPIPALVDDFNDNSRDTAKWPNAYTSSATFAETGGQMVVTLANAIAGSNYAGYNTAANTYNLTGLSAYVQIPTVPSGANCQVLLKLDGGSSNILYWQINNTTLAAVQSVAGVQTTVFSVAYNSTNHKWLRIQENAGITFWDVSADGLTWTNLWYAANPITITALIVEISAGTFGSQATPGTAVFDNFNCNIPLVGKDIRNGNNNFGAIIGQAINRGAIF